MKITKKRLLNLFAKNWKSRARHQLIEGYTVPRFETQEDMYLFLDELEPEEEVDNDVVNPESGEVVIFAGESPLDAGLVVLPAAPEETEPEELDHYDWAKWEEEQANTAREKRKKVEDALDTAQEQAVSAGIDWARDTMHDAGQQISSGAAMGMMGRDFDSAEDYVRQLGQDAAGDIASGITEWGMGEIADVYRTLPDREPVGGAYALDGFVITKTGFKENVADYVYDGVLKGIDEWKRDNP